MLGHQSVRVPEQGATEELESVEYCNPFVTKQETRVREEPEEENMLSERKVEPEAMEESQGNSKKSAMG